MEWWSVFQILALIGVLFDRGVSSTEYECRDAVAPPTKPRGVNQINRTSLTPIFRLHLKPLQPETAKKTNPATSYKVTVSIENGFPLHFSEVTLSVSVNGSCGSGDFDFFPGNYDDIVQDDGDQCPRLLHTRQLQSTNQLPPLVWTPPDCGCVRMRILIRDSGQVYYAENKDVSKGPLMKTICFARQQLKPTKISRKQRINSLCHVIDKYSSSEIITRRLFLRHRKLDQRYMDYLGLEMAMELRRSDAMTCCSKVVDNDKMKCFEAARKRRIDGFCADGVPDIPFKTFRQRHMRQLERSCCFILGERRYRCFARNSGLKKKIEGSSIYDYSMDASDIVNDLTDFGSHELLDENLRPIGKQYDDNDDADDEEGSDAEDEDVEEDSDESIEDKNDGSVDLDQVSEELLVASDMDLEDGRNRQIVESYPVRKANPRKSPWGKNSSTNAMKRMKKRKNRTSKEARISSAERRKNYDRKYSRSRGRGGNSLTRNSKERRGEGRRPKSSAERRNRKDRGGRRPMRKEDLMTTGNVGFDDQGGYSIDRTLKKLNKKMKRLKLQRTCCRAGVEIGKDVYGALSQVTNECNHGSQKFILNINLGSKPRKCIDRFVRCCMEHAKKGLTMTSQEFVEGSLLNNWDNYQKYESKLFDKVLSQRGRNSRPQNNRRIANTQRNNRPVDLTGTRLESVQKGAIRKPAGKGTSQTSETLTTKVDQEISNTNNNNMRSQNTSIKNQEESRSPKIVKQDYNRDKTLFSDPNSLIQPGTNRKFNAQSIGALDSREMAAINTKTYKDALDSREMADEYANKRQRSNKWRRTFKKLKNRSLAKRWRSRLG